MTHITCGAMPGATTPIEKAPVLATPKALIPTLATLILPRPAHPVKPFAPPLATSPDKAAILVALTRQIDTPDVFTVQSLTTKNRIKAAMGGTAK